MRRNVGNVIVNAEDDSRKFHLVELCSYEPRRAKKLFVQLQFIYPTQVYYFSSVLVIFCSNVYGRTSGICEQDPVVKLHESRTSNYEFTKIDDSMDKISTINVSSPFLTFSYGSFY